MQMSVYWFLKDGLKLKNQHKNRNETIESKKNKMAMLCELKLFDFNLLLRCSKKRLQTLLNRHEKGLPIKYKADHRLLNLALYGERKKNKKQSMRLK